MSYLQYSLSSSFNGTAAAAVAGNYTNIRLIRVPRVVAPVPYVRPKDLLLRSFC
jgi:hypothetical protein